MIPIRRASSSALFVRLIPMTLFPISLNRLAKEPPIRPSPMTPTVILLKSLVLIFSLFFLPDYEIH